MITREDLKSEIEIKLGEAYSQFESFAKSARLSAAEGVQYPNSSADDHLKCYELLVEVMPLLKLYNSNFYDEDFKDKERRIEEFLGPLRESILIFLDPNKFLEAVSKAKLLR